MEPATRKSKANTLDDELLVIPAQQHREIMTDQALESDLDFAFQLQLQETLADSLALHISSSPTSPIPQLHDTDKLFNVGSLKRIELECRDRQLCELETEKNLADVLRQFHDLEFARDVDCMSEDEWEEWGDDFERPFDKGCSSSASSSSSKTADRLDTFRVYFKSFVCDALIGNSNAPLVGGIGIAICDSRDNLIFKLRKAMPESDRSRIGADFSALIEGLNAALLLNLTRVEFYYDSFPLFQYVRGRWTPKQSKIRALVNQVSLLRNKFAFIDDLYVARKDIKYAFKLAHEAVDAQINKPPESSSSQANSTLEICVICLDNKLKTQIFQTDTCSHRYCFSCMKQHVEVKLLDGILPKCPHENCNSELKIDNCKVFLPAKLVEILSQRMKEATIPATEKVYCPFPKCSALMSRKEIRENMRSTDVDPRQNKAMRCVSCENIFCISCKVPWHKNLTCYDYKRLNPGPPAEEVKLKKLADVNLWRQCKKCSNMIELSDGCNHITCRCGFEFCYTCGAKWKNKKATCSCPLWEEENILNEDEFSDEDD